MRKTRKIKPRAPVNLTAVTLKMILWLIFLFAAVFFLFWVYDRSAWFPIRQFEVVTPEGELRHLTAWEIKTIIQPYQKENNFLKIDLTALKKQFDKLPWLADARVERVWPDTIRISLRERMPVARWGNTRLLVDADGEAFSGATDLPLVTFFGPEGTTKKVFAFYAEAEPMLKAKNLKLQALEYTSRSSWVLILSTGTKIYLGRDDAIPRLQRLLQVWESLERADTRKMKAIHLEYRRGLAVDYEP